MDIYALIQKQQLFFLVLSLAPLLNQGYQFFNRSFFISNCEFHSSSSLILLSLSSNLSELLIYFTCLFLCLPCFVVRPLYYYSWYFLTHENIILTFTQGSAAIPFLDLQFKTLLTIFILNSAEYFIFLHLDLNDSIPCSQYWRLINSTNA